MYFKQRRLPSYVYVYILIWGTGFFQRVFVLVRRIVKRSLEENITSSHVCCTLKISNGTCDEMCTALRLHVQQGVIWHNSPTPVAGILLKLNFAALKSSCTGTSGAYVCQRHTPYTRELNRGVSPCFTPEKKWIVRLYIRSMKFHRMVLYFRWTYEINLQKYVAIKQKKKLN